MTHAKHEASGFARLTFTVITGLALLACAACSEPNRPDGGKGLLPIGAQAPDLRGKNASGELVSLADTRGRPSVVYFYPKDGTPGCTKEACAFRDAWQAFEDAGVTVFGVSADSEQSHEEFRREHALPFPLVSDESGALTQAYGVSTRLGMPARVTFLVDPAGRIAKVWNDVDPGVHAREVLEAAREHKGAASPQRP